MKLYLLFIINCLLQYSIQSSSPINVFSDIQTDPLTSNYIKVTSILGGSQYIPMDQNVYLTPCNNNIVAPYQVIEVKDTTDFNVNDYVCLNDSTKPYTGDFGKYQFRNFNAKDPIYYGQVNEIQGSEQRSLIQVTNGQVSVYPSFTPIPNNTINSDIIQLFTQDSTQLYLNITGFKQCPIGTKTSWYIENHASENYKIYLCTDGDVWDPQFKTTQSQLITYDQIGQQFTQTFSDHKTAVTDCTRQAYYYKHPSSGKYTSLCFKSGNEQVCSNDMQFIDRSQTSNMINVMPIYYVQPMKYLRFQESVSDRYIYKDDVQGTIRETYVMHQDIDDSETLLRFNVPIVIQGQTIKQSISEYFATNRCHLSQLSSGTYIEYGNHKIYFAETG